MQARVLIKKQKLKLKGFSSRNLKYMRAFAEAYPDQQFVQEALAQITWYHHITLLDKVKDSASLRQATGYQSEYLQTPQGAGN